MSARPAVESKLPQGKYLMPKKQTRIPPPPPEGVFLKIATPDDANADGRSELTSIQLPRLRGRPKSASPKILLSVRYSTEVVAYFKATGEGWQSRMDEVLREYVRQQQAGGMGLASPLGSDAFHVVLI